MPHNESQVKAAVRVVSSPSNSSGEAEPFPAQGAPREPKAGYIIVKRCVDLLLVPPLFVLFILAYCVVGLFLILEDGFPILYTREAVGLDGKRFRIFKFRSMRKDADTYFDRHPDQASAFHCEMKLKKDPRILRVGRVIRKASIDEIPQVLNVLRGEMSFVGPRYVHPDELARYGAFAKVRIRMIPGITGLWQIGGRNDIPYDQRVIYDRTYYYVRSIAVDLVILLRTIPVVLSRKGVF